MVKNPQPGVNAKRMSRIITPETRRDRMSGSNRTTRMRLAIVKRQQTIFLTLFGVGLFLLALGLYMVVSGQESGTNLIGEGIAFITIGSIGMIMSWTTFDIGNSIKDAVKEIGMQNQEIGRQNLEVSKQNLEVSKEISEATREISKSQEVIAKLLDRMIES